MAQSPADIVFDQTIERFGLDQYDMLVLPKCEVLSESVVRAIEDFQRRGGIVVADQYLGPQLDAIRFDFDFDYRGRVTANAIVKNENVAAWDDHIDPSNAEMIAAEGVTAKVDQAIMEDYAARLRAELDGRVQRQVDCDNPTVLTNLCEADGVDYLFVINDKRDYDDRVGEYRSVLGQVVPQTATISLTNHDVVAYDMLRRQRLAIEDGKLKVDLDELAGTIIALYPAPIDTIEVSAPSSVQCGEAAPIAVTMTAADGAALSGLQPLQVTIIDPDGNQNDFGGYHLARGGRLHLPFTAAINDTPGQWSITVTDLTAGLETQATFNVVR
jgi:hypothetical protein